MKKGITILSLVITIIVMGILVGAIAGVGLESIEFATANRFATEILSIQTAVDEYYYKHNNYPSKTDYVLDTTSIVQEQFSQFDSETVVNNKINLKTIDLSLLGITGTEFGAGIEERDVYVLSEITGKVYYIQGVIYEDKTYYALTSELREVLEMDVSVGIPSSRDIKVYDIIFTPSTVSYTNSSVSVNVKAPKQAIINNITVTNGKSISSEITEGLYKTFRVNETSEDKTGNYTIEVNYTYDDVEKTAKYDVDYYDDEAPNINEVIKVVGGVKTITVSPQDNNSGIRTVKYVEKPTNDIEYVKKYGKTAIGNQISMSSFSGYTIYVEDNAGNNAKVTEIEVPDDWRASVITMYDGTPIPAGFAPSQASDEKKKNNGLVIYQGTDVVTNDNVEHARRNRNQYVWVPVKDFTKFVRKYYIPGTSELVNTLGTSSKYWELIIDTTLNMPVSQQNLNFVSSYMLTEAQEMYNSVKKYGGFYVARYETGIENERQDLSDEIVVGLENAYSMMGKKAYTWINWGNSLSDDTGGAVQVSRSLYTKTNSNFGAVSTLIYGVQWDAIMEWLLESEVVTQSGLIAESTQYGNYRDYEITDYSEINSESKFARYSSRDSISGVIGEYNPIREGYAKSSDGIHLLTTGALKTAKLNNVYDLAGNALEWTMEGRSTYGRVRRGGSCVYRASTYPLASRYGASVAGRESIDSINGFRVALYIK